MKAGKGECCSGWRPKVGGLLWVFIALCALCLQPWTPALTEADRQHCSEMTCHSWLWAKAGLKMLLFAHLILLLFLVFVAPVAWRWYDVSMWEMKESNQPIFVLFLWKYVTDLKLFFYGFGLQFIGANWQTYTETGRKGETQLSGHVHRKRNRKSHDLKNVFRFPVSSVRHRRRVVDTRESPGWAAPAWRRQRTEAAAALLVRAETIDRLIDREVFFLCFDNRSFSVMRIFCFCDS